LFLHSKGNANSRKGDGTLSTVSAEAGEPCDIFVHDPEVPVIAPGGPAAASGQFDQAAMELGNNLLVYSTEPLEKPLWILGAPRVVLYCATSLGTADFTAKLVRAKPNGAVEFICIGIARSNRLFAETGYAADKIHRWEFFLEPTSCRFAKGERIRLEIAGSAFPLFDRNPGSDVPSCRATSWDWRRSTHFVYHGGEHPSALFLPASEAPE
jgi:putative CocE/NonD family hydrolase